MGLLVLPHVVQYKRHHPQVDRWVAAEKYTANYRGVGDWRGRRHRTELVVTSNLGAKSAPRRGFRQRAAGAHLLSQPVAGSNRPWTGWRTRAWISPYGLLALFRLPLNGFTYYWALSSKFFSTFTHGTCSLSITWSYLALDGVYHHLSAPLSRNMILWSLQYLRYYP